MVGDRVVSDGLRAWFDSYKGTGDGAPNLEAFPEPFLGDLFAQPRAVFLALNPGPVAPPFQYAGGSFVDEIKAMGSYTEWASSWPYLREPWGYNRHHQTRLGFLRRWYADSTFSGKEMLAFELYPWHSETLNSRFRWSAEARYLVDRHVWQPISAAGAEYVFGVGAPFEREFEALKMPILGLLGVGGEPVPFEKKRRVLVAQPARGVIALAMNNFNQAAPPNERDTKVLRNALEERGWTPSWADHP